MIVEGNVRGIRNRVVSLATTAACAAALACSADAPEGASVEPRAPVTTQRLVPKAADVLQRTRSDVLVLDVRTSEEFAAGRLPGATRIHVDALDEAIDDGTLPASAHQPILVYCRSGNRSSRAAEILADRGYTEVFDLVGGLEAWQESGLPIER